MKRMLVLAVGVALAFSATPSHSFVPPPPAKPALPKVGGLSKVPIYSISKFTERLVNGHPVAVPRLPKGIEGQSSSASSGSCDAGAPNDGWSCYGWWAADSVDYEYWCPWDCPDFEIYWKVVFWTDAGNNTVTNFQTVYCEDRPIGWMDVEKSCQTGHEAAPGYELRWNANWWYVKTYCPYSYSEHSHIFVSGTVNADHLVAGVRYEKSNAEFCS